MRAILKRPAPWRCLPAPSRTIIAVDAAGSDAPPLSGRRLAPVAALAVATATLLVFAGL